MTNPTAQDYLTAAALNVQAHTDETLAEYINVDGNLSPGVAKADDNIVRLFDAGLKSLEGSRLLVQIFAALNGIDIPHDDED